MSPGGAFSSLPHSWVEVERFRPAHHKLREFAMRRVQEEVAFLQDDGRRHRQDSGFIVAIGPGQRRQDRLTRASASGRDIGQFLPASAH